MTPIWLKLSNLRGITTGDTMVNKRCQQHLTPDNFLAYGDGDMEASTTSSLSCLSVWELEDDDSLQEPIGTMILLMSKIPT